MFLRIAVDAMGGDHAPRSAVDGALLAVKEDSSLTVVLVGDETAIRQCLPADCPATIEIHHTTEIIEPEDEPVRAVRRKKDSSMVVMIDLAKQGRVDAAISAGNTGALMTAGLLIAGRMKGIERPALAAFIPNSLGKASLLLDVGANMDAKPMHLLQYAIMGSVYADKTLGFAKPRVGLLNVGTEAGKGNELCKEAYPLLASANLNFIGNVEARDAMQGTYDVLVCDGFSGNVMLKTLEGAASTIFSLLREEFTSSFLNKVAASILKPALGRFKKRMDYSTYGGVPLLGLCYPVFKAHGSSNSNAMKNAILVAAKYVTNDVNALIQKELEQFIQPHTESE